MSVIYNLDGSEVQTDIVAGLRELANAFERGEYKSDRVIVVCDPQIWYYGKPAPRATLIGEIEYAKAQIIQG